ncbi:hypothetical protein GCM10022286_19560 [Gryllotalpicola daejeonensis]|uniref:VWA domain-containing protein n=2 Tax=Gryllotalpicola daejeonensis TaxID=993087 RepID=A0ABP7ZL60_9MICO
MVLAVLPSGQNSAPSAAAEPPPAQAGSAVIGLFVAGNRISETQVEGVGGATFGFFASRPQEANLDPDTGLVTGMTPVATCTSTADGWCNVVVPIGAGGVAAGTRLWISPIALPAGWTSPAYWQTAPLTTSAATRLQTQHVFQTPALQSGGRYVSTAQNSGFLDDPGDTVSDTAFMNSNGGSTGSGTTSNNFQRRTASAGFWPLVETNPPLPEQCGVNIALVVDLSSSIQQAGELNNLKAALTNGVDSLRGTPSQLAIITFGTDSPANGFPGSNTGLMPVATTADANAIKAHFAGWNNIPTNYTNWDAGLNAVSELNATTTSATHVDLAIVLTDGNPTVYGSIPGSNTNNPSIPTGSGFTRFRELENATASANKLKAEGTRVVAVGVGDGLDETSSYNLRTISGTHRYIPGTDIHGTDYLQEDTYAEAAGALRQLIVGLCAPTITVVKQVIPPGGTIADAYTPPDPWEFTASTTTPGASVTPPATKETDQYTGATNFDVTVPENGTGTFNVAETQKPGYTLEPVSADGTSLDPNGQNAFCTNKTEDDEAIPVTNTDPTGFQIDLGAESAITCIVYNRAPDPPPGDLPAHVVVHKRWSVTTASGTTTYVNGDQPEDLEAFLHLGGPAPDGISDQPWDEPRYGYVGSNPDASPPGPGEDVDVAETVNLIPPGCTLTSATMTGTGITGALDLGTAAPATTVPNITAGLNEWTITNAVSCVSHLVLVKQVLGGPASPDSWTLTAHPPTSALPGPSGTTGVASEVTPEVSYQLAEQAGDDPELLNYVQHDVREQPIRWPLSTGSADCAQTVNGEVQPGDPMGADGSVSVPLGQTFTCTFTNTAAPLTIIKNVDGGTAAASDFHFTVAPVPPAPAGLPTRSITGAASPGSDTIVRPGQEYRITEAEGPPGYQLIGLQCDIGGTTVSGESLTIPAGSAAVCTATNSYSLWTAEKSSDPPSGRVTPGTVITYTLTARLLDGNPTHDAVVTDDVSRVFSGATLVGGSLTTSAGSAEFQGDHLVWTIPLLSDVETASFRVRVDEDAVGTTIFNQLIVDPAAVDCATLADAPPHCDTTSHEVVAIMRLPDTGSSVPWWAAAAAAGLALVGGLLVAFRRRLS